MTAIQMVSEHGRVSPRWGHWNHTGYGEELQEIRFEAGGGEAAGLKFFIGNGGGIMSLEDQVARCVQALKRSGE